MILIIIIVKNYTYKINNYSDTVLHDFNYC